MSIYCTHIVEVKESLQPIQYKIERSGLNI